MAVETLSRGILALSLGVMFCCGCSREPVIGGYAAVTIQPRTLKIELLRPMPLRYDENDTALPLLGDYYTSFTNEWGDISYEHYHQSVPGEPRVRYSHLEGGKDHIIHKLTKQQEILGGDFGTVYVEKVCYFHLPTASYQNHLWVTSYTNQSEHELPAIQDSEPSQPRNLTHISLLRVFQRPPGFVVVTAVYTPDGKIQHLWVNGSKGGNWVHPSEFPEYSDGFLIYSGNQKQRHALARYGFPEGFDAASYLKGPKAPFRSAPMELQLSTVNLHYDFNRWLRQDQFPARGPRTTRYLTFAHTYEDSVLEGECAKGFAALPPWSQ